MSLLFEGREVGGRFFMKRDDEPNEFPSVFVYGGKLLHC
jgi:hypothetical protein